MSNANTVEHLVSAAQQEELSRQINPDDNKVAKWAPEVLMHPTRMLLRDIIKNPEYYYAPQGLIQRLYTAWPEGKRNEYLHDLFSGAASKDLFIFAEIQPIIEGLTIELETEVEDKDRKQSITENLEYFQNLFSKGVKFLIIDGQHRMEEIKEFFKVNSKIPYKAPAISRISKIPKVLNGITVEGKTYNLNGRSFGTFPKNLQTELLDNISIAVTIIRSGDIRELKGLFRKANSGTPLSFFEILISDSYGAAWRYIMKFCNVKTQNNHVLSIVKKFHGFSGEFAPNQMGLEYAFSELLLYVASNYGQEPTLPITTNTKDSLNHLFDFEFDKLTKKRRDLHSEILTIIGNGTAPLKGKTKGIKRCDLVDLFFMISMLLDTKHPSREKGFPKFKINEPVVFIKALFKMLVQLKQEDFYLMEKNGDITTRLDLEGNLYKVKNPNSYSEHQRAIWDSGNLRHRESMMWNKFSTEFLDELEMRGIISRVGKAVTDQAKKRQEVAVQNDFKDKYGEPLDIYDDVFGQNKSHDLGHIVAKSKGGDDSAENLQYEHSSANRSKGAN